MVRKRELQNVTHQVMLRKSKSKATFEIFESVNFLPEVLGMSSSVASSALVPLELARRISGEI